MTNRREFSKTVPRLIANILADYFPNKGSSFPGCFFSLNTVFTGVVLVKMLNKLMGVSTSLLIQMIIYSSPMIDVLIKFKYLGFDI